MSFPEQDRPVNWKFFEIWADTTASPPYILMVLGEEPEYYHVADPADSYHTIFSSQSYDEVRLWLLEDEYEKAEGRVFAESERNTPLQYNQTIIHSDSMPEYVSH